MDKRSMRLLERDKSYEFSDNLEVLIFKIYESCIMIISNDKIIYMLQELAK